MTLNAIRNTLSSEELIEENPFSLLQEISIYVNNTEDETIGRELVLRALDKRECFREYMEILDSMTRQVGLFPYLDPNELSLKDSLAYEFHRPPSMDETFVFHSAQSEIYHRLMDGENVILSAPTSFGKSRIIDAILATNKFKNITVVVPTIALIDETRRRLSIFSDQYKVVTQLSQMPGDKNIFVFTAERVVAYEHFPQVDFFVIDEFYKIGAMSEDETRTIALNQAFYKLHKGGGQFYLLGPSIRRIPDGLEDKFRCYFFSTAFETVVSEIIPVYDWKDDLERLVALTEDLDGQTLIFCKSPKRVNEVTRALVERHVCGQGTDFHEAAEWVSDNFHPQWIFQKALLNGIGMHHGKLPRSLAQFSVRAFNEGKLKFLVCTSTLIEGVNTSAKNVIIFDFKIANKKFDFFTFNNIRGRSGRMFHHFVGKVYLFHPPPEEELPFVDFPIYTQGDSTPDSLLIQLDEDDLKESSKSRLSEVYDQELLPLAVIQKNSGIDPKSQIKLAEHLSALNNRQTELLCWCGVPTWDQLTLVCELIWEYFLDGHGKSGINTARQLVYKTHALIKKKSISKRIEEELKPGSYAAKSPDEAVERILVFDRLWAGFELPRLLMALSRIQEAVFLEKYGRTGDYALFSHKVETMFRNPVAVALEEYGLPVQITDKIELAVRLGEDIDTALSVLKSIQSSDLPLDEFELNLLDDVKKQL